MGKYFSNAATMAGRRELCRCPDGLARANGVSTALSEAQARAVPRAVYVIGVEGESVAKIGVSHAPVNRCVSLQQSHYRELFLYGAAYLVGSAQCEPRSAERRVGTECVSPCRYGWSPFH